MPGYLNGNSSADEELREILNAELPNGRLAMTAIKAMLFQNGTEGIIDPKYGNSGFPGCLCGKSVTFAKLRKKLSAELADERKKLGVQAPVGLGDPAGSTSNKDACEFRRRRVGEPERGRARG